MNHLLRPMCPQDRALVIDTWCRSYHAHASCWMGFVSCDTFVTCYRPTVERLLCESFTRVACLPGEESAVIGWACVRGKHLHYVWVRGDWRKEGVATDLLRDLAADPIRYTHETDYWRMVAPHYPGWRFDARPLKEAR